MQLKVELRRQCNKGTRLCILKSMLKEELAANDGEADNTGDMDNVGDMLIAPLVKHISLSMIWSTLL